MMKESYPGKPLFLLGYSMGGTVTLSLLQQWDNICNAALLINPYIQNAEPVPCVCFLKCLARCFPRCAAVDVMGEIPEFVKHYYADPLVYDGKVRLRTGLSISVEAERVEPRLEEITTDFHLTLSTKDRIVSVPAIRDFVKRARSKEKVVDEYNCEHRVYSYENLYREVVKKQTEFLENYLRN